MTEMEPPQTSSTLLSPEGLYFQIVCDPGHERTTRELHQLPRESRERVWADMTGANLDTRKSFCHSSFGSNSDLHPHPEGNSSLKVNKHLEKLNNEINLLPRTEALELALNSQVGKDSEFRLAFLRTCDFDETQAAERFGRHFDQKMALFGKAKVGLPIRLQDLSADDLESLKCGAIQFLPKTDRGGRLVLVSRYRDFVYKHRNNMLRALWYMLMSALDTGHISDAGMVIVGYEIGDFVPVDYELTRQMFHLVRNFPFQVVASHSCYSSSPMEKVADLIVHMVSSFVRLRLRMHYGSHQECRYRLLTMGIPVEFLPITTDGMLHTENHRQWLQTRIWHEEKEGYVSPSADRASDKAVSMEDGELMET